MLEAEYEVADLKDVPIERLIGNVQRRIAKEPNHPYWHYVLGRVHSMAYATGRDKMDAITRIWVKELGGREIVEPLPFIISDIDYERTGIEPISSLSNFGVFRSTRVAVNFQGRKRRKMHLTLAIQSYEKAHAMDSKDAYVLLGLAWCLEEAGDLRRASDFYRQCHDVLAQKAVQVRLSGADMITESAQGYIRVLERQGKKEEARQFRQSHEKTMGKVRKLPTAVTPVVFPIGAPQVVELAAQNLSASHAVTFFDMFGNKEPALWQWPPEDFAFLVWDPEGSGKIHWGRQFFGSVTWWIFWEDGYQPLSLLDDNGNGWLEGNELNGISVWCDKNSDGISQPGEVQSSRAMRITAVRCYPDGKAKGMPFAREGLRSKDGSTRPTVDWFSKRKRIFPQF